MRTLFMYIMCVFCLLLVACGGSTPSPRTSPKDYFFDGVNTGIALEDSCSESKGYFRSRGTIGTEEAARNEIPEGIPELSGNGTILAPWYHLQKVDGGWFYAVCEALPTAFVEELDPPQPETVEEMAELGGCVVRDAFFALFNLALEKAYNQTRDEVFRAMARDRSPNKPCDQVVLLVLDMPDYMQRAVIRYAKKGEVPEAEVSILAGAVIRSMKEGKLDGELFIEELRKAG